MNHLKKFDNFINEEIGVFGGAVIFFISLFAFMQIIRTIARKNPEWADRTGKKLSLARLRLGGEGRSRNLKVEKISDGLYKVTTPLEEEFIDLNNKTLTSYKDGKSFRPIQLDDEDVEQFKDVLE